MDNPLELVYCIDSSALIDLVHTYPPEIFPGLWERIGELAVGGRLLTVKQVRGECQDKELVAWFKNHGNIIVRISARLLENVTRISADLYAADQWLVDPSSDRDAADPYVVALALSENESDDPRVFPRKAVVVQHEKPTKNRRGRVKIPDVCGRYGLECLSLVEMVRSEGWHF